MEEFEKLLGTTLQSTPLTHSRLKHIAGLAQTTEDHISRLGMGLSLSIGSVSSEWSPDYLKNEENNSLLMKEKQLRGRTLFKEELAVWMALVLKHQAPDDYSEWRQVMRAHWERGVQILMEKALKEKDWIRTVNSCLLN